MGTPNLPHQEPGMPVTENMILDALRAVRDPERDGDIVSLGMVTGVVIRGGNVGFAIEVEPERGARLEPLRKAAERAVEALPDVMSVTAVLTAEAKPPGGARRAAPRSEEHTSELQSRFDLVCRLLLEKKKISRNKITSEVC